jgi:hypothetical protein
VEIGREAQDILGQLSEWAKVVDDLEQAIHKEKKKPALFKKLTFGNATKEAFDEYTARVKMREWEGELRHMFLYGDLCHLGLDGYREFIEIRRQIRERRIRESQDWQMRRKQFVEDLMLYGMVAGVILIAALTLWALIDLIFETVGI